MKDWIDYFLRFLFYLIGKFLLLMLIIVILVVSFLAAKDYMNINVLVGDGFSERASVILKDGDIGNLAKIFSEEYIERDYALYNETYDPYIIRSFIQDIDIKFKIVMPWVKKVTIKTTETINDIDGEIPSDQITEDMSEAEITPPKWNNGEYDVTLERFETTWKIIDVEKTKVLD